MWIFAVQCRISRTQKKCSDLRWSMSFKLHLYIDSKRIANRKGDFPLWVAVGMGSELDWCKVALISLVHMRVNSRQLKWHNFFEFYFSFCIYWIYYDGITFKAAWSHTAHKTNKSREVKWIQFPGAVGSWCNSQGHHMIYFRRSSCLLLSELTEPAVLKTGCPKFGLSPRGKGIKGINHGSMDIMDQ